MLQRDGYIWEHRITNQFQPLTVLYREHSWRGPFHQQGSLDAILGELTKVELNLPKVELIPFELDDSDKQWLAEKHGLTLENTFIADCSHLKDQIVEFMRANVVVEKTWREVLGKHIWIVTKSVYARKLEHVESSRFLWTTTTSRFTLESKNEAHPLMVAFKGIRLRINRDGTIGKIKEF